MSDSLRDQLKKAGFKEPTPKTRNVRKQEHAAGNAKGPIKRHQSGAQQKNKLPAGSKGKPQPTEAEKAAGALKKKAIKEQIKTLIETHKIKEHAGTVAFSYQLGSRVKQLFVTDICQQKLANGELLITRLNGNTFLIPPDIADEIIKLNPDWALIKAGSQNTDGSVDEAYAEFKVPDDLNW